MGLYANTFVWMHANSYKFAWIRINLYRNCMNLYKFVCIHCHGLKPEYYWRPLCMLFSQVKGSNSLLVCRPCSRSGRQAADQFWEALGNSGEALEKLLAALVAYFQVVS